MAYRLRCSVIIVCLLLSSCILVGPNYKEPVKKIPSHWIKKDPLVKEAPIKNANWWSMFHDQTLTSLIYQGYQNNLSLQSAAVHVLQARATLAQSVGELYPQQQALTSNLEYNRMGGSSLQTLLPSNFYTAMLGTTANWELDFWGKYRRAILANDATFLASFAAYDNALVSLTADIASIYVDIRTTEALIKVAEKNINVQALSLKIAEARFNAGQTSLLDVEQAKTELAQTESTLPKFKSSLQRAKDALAVLLGTTPDQVDVLISKKQGIPVTPAAVAVGIPKEALAKRPDIAQARLEAIAQSEAIGAIKANLYPSFALAGTFVFASNTIAGNSLGELFHWSNRNVLAGPSVSWPLLNYGQITNEVRAQDAAFQQALLNYLNVVLKAEQEVQDNITEFIETKKAEKDLNRANQSAIKATRLAIIRYREGESDYTPVLDAERQQFRVETSLTYAKGDIPKAFIALYRSLGGGWQLRQCNDIVPLAIKKEMGARTDWGDLLKTENHEPPQTQAQQAKERYLPDW